MVEILCSRRCREDQDGPMGTIDTGLAMGVGLALTVELSLGRVVAGFDDAGFRVSVLFGFEMITGGCLGFAALE